MSTPPLQHVAVLGGGPAGIGCLVLAERTGALSSLLRRGVVILDKNNAANYGSGNLGSYAIPSNTSASTFANHFVKPADPEAPSRLFKPLAHSSVLRDIGRYKHAPCPLQLAGKVLALAGSKFRQQLGATTGCEMHFGATVQSITLQADGTLVVAGIDSEHRPVRVRVRNVVMAMGAVQSLHTVHPPVRSITLTGLHFLTQQGIEATQHRLRHSKSRRCRALTEPSQSPSEIYLAPPPGGATWAGNCGFICRVAE